LNAPELSVVIPVHNEAENIGPLLEEICAVLAGVVSFEVVVVDDKSTDDTLACLKACGTHMLELRIIRHGCNAGQSAALRTGIRFARAPIVATLDGDGQNDPADIPKLLARYRAAADAPLLLIVGHRTMRRDTAVTRAASRIANAVRGTFLGDRTPDSGCGLKLFARDLFLALPDFDHMHRFLPALVLRAGGRVLSVPVRHRARRSGRSHYGINNRVWTGIVDMLGVAWLIRRARLPDAVEVGILFVPECLGGQCQARGTRANEAPSPTREDQCASCSAVRYASEATSSTSRSGTPYDPPDQ
jgi:dolichol-phosphate mannosyltransferase